MATAPEQSASEAEREAESLGLQEKAPQPGVEVAPPRRPAPLPSDALEVQADIADTRPGHPESLSEAELTALLGDAPNSDQWPGVLAPVIAAGWAPACAAEHRTGGQPELSSGRSELLSPPPDAAPAGARAPERQLTQIEIDALLARLLGG